MVVVSAAVVQSLSFFRRLAVVVVVSAVVPQAVATSATTANSASHRFRVIRIASLSGGLVAATQRYLPDAGSACLGPQDLGGRRDGETRTNTRNLRL